MKLFQEFREFAIRGNAIDLAIAVIMGAAFGKITTSVVEDLIMPPLGLLTGGVDFTAMKLELKPAEGKAPAVTLNYGQFLNVVFQFIIIAFVVFLLVKAINRAKEKFAATPEAVVPTTRSCPRCLSEIPLAATRCKFCTSDVSPT